MAKNSYPIVPQKNGSGVPVIERPDNKKAVQLKNELKTSFGSITDLASTRGAGGFGAGRPSKGVGKLGPGKGTKY